MTQTELPVDLQPPTVPAAGTPTPRPRWRTLGAGLVLLALQACGGGNDASTAVVEADEFTLAVGQSGNLLANDRIGDVAADAGPDGNVTVQSTTGLPTWARVVDGLLTVDAGAVAGRTSFSYTLCTRADATACADAAVVLNVPAPALTATADSVVLAPGGTADVLGNDTLDGAPAVATRVAVTATEVLPTGISLSPAGVLSVAAGASTGEYSLAYRVCLIAMPASCATAAMAVTVPALASLQGRVVDAATALGVDGARVAANGISTTTDSNGIYTLAGLPTEQPLTVLFTDAAHVQLARTARLTASGVTDLTVRFGPPGSGDRPRRGCRRNRGGAWRCGAAGVATGSRAAGRRQHADRHAAAAPDANRPIGRSVAAAR